MAKSLRASVSASQAREHAHEGGAKNVCGVCSKAHENPSDLYRHIVNEHSPYRRHADNPGKFASKDEAHAALTAVVLDDKEADEMQGLCSGARAALRAGGKDFSPKDEGKRIISLSDAQDAQESIDKVLEKLREAEAKVNLGICPKCGDKTLAADKSKCKVGSCGWTA